VVFGLGSVDALGQEWLDELPLLVGETELVGVVCCVHREFFPHFYFPYTLLDEKYFQCLASYVLAFLWGDEYSPEGEELFFVRRGLLTPQDNSECPLCQQVAIMAHEIALSHFICRGFWGLKDLCDWLLLHRPLSRIAGFYMLTSTDYGSTTLYLRLLPCLSRLSVEHIYKQTLPQRVEPRSLAVFECGRMFGLDPVFEQRWGKLTKPRKVREKWALQFWNQHAPEGWRYLHPQSGKVFRRAYANAYRALHQQENGGQEPEEG